MNLYKKLLLAQGPIALALGCLGIFSVAAISYLGSHSQTILKDNYRSVLAAQRMKEAIERMDSAALFLVADQREKGIEQAGKNRPIFEAELKVQEGNITEAGEKEFTEGLRAAWKDYQAKFDRLAGGSKHRGDTTALFLGTGSGILQGQSVGRRDPGNQSRHNVAQERHGAPDRRAHECDHHYGGVRRSGGGTFGLDVVDSSHAAAAVGAQRSHAQNRGR